MAGTRHIVPVVVADYLPVKLKAPLFVKVSIYPDLERKIFVFEGTELITGQSVEAAQFNLAVVETVRRTFRYYLVMCSALENLAPNLQDEYRQLHAVFDYPKE